MIFMMNLEIYVSDLLMNKKNLLSTTSQNNKIPYKQTILKKSKDKILNHLVALKGLAQSLAYNKEQFNK